MKLLLRSLFFPVLALCFTGCQLKQSSSQAMKPLFPEDGVPRGWVVRQWSDLAKPAESNVVWTVAGGILHGSPDRGTWLVSEREYGNFELDFEFKLGPQGNSGLALRTPMRGDPAFDAMELQMVDQRYKPDSKDTELTGAIYRALPPRQQVYKPLEWNHYQVTLSGSGMRVLLNGVVIHDLDLDQQSGTGLRHDGSSAPPLKDRPRKGHLGFQELSRGKERVQIRNARLRELPDK
jgi:hypothetical protein